MDYNIPSHITPATLVKAARLAKNAKSIDFYVGNVYWDETGPKSTRDDVYFMFTNKFGDLILVHCCPHLYFVEKFSSNQDGDFVTKQYAFVTNIRHLVFWLRREGYYDCEHLKEEEQDDTETKERD